MTDITAYGITASKELWQAVGVTVYNDGRPYFGLNSDQKIADLHIAKMEAAAADWRTLAWLSKELQRRKEESTREWNKKELAKAINNYAEAIKTNPDKHIYLSLDEITRQTEYY